MLWLILIIVVGLSYLFYRYTSVSNKKTFFKSPLFRSVLGSITLLLVAIATVNVADVESSETSSDVAYTFRLKDIDTTSAALLSSGPAYTYKIITSLGDSMQLSSLLELEKTYERFKLSTDERESSLGNFGLGVIDLASGHPAEARGHFMEVQAQELPFLHFCIAEALYAEGEKEEAALEYEKELLIPGGNRITAYETLIDIYDEYKNYDKLHVLLDSDLAEKHFPPWLARRTLFKVNDYLHYSSWVMKLFTQSIHVIGFIAALMISVLWLAYLYYLDIFSPGRFIWLVAMFAGGMFLTLGVFPITDSIWLYTSWSMNGEFLNDLFYCVLRIGVPEELMKVIPLVLLASFSKNLKEPVDYLIYGSASALGFAFMENLLYFAEIKNGIIHGRAYFSVIGHMMFTTVVAYAFVTSKYKIKNKRTLMYRLPSGFLLAATFHGIYDLLLFHNHIFWFYIFFILIIQYWIMMINNAMNNSVHFSYSTAVRAEGSRLFVTLGLTAVFALEYVHAGFSQGTGFGNSQLLSNIGFAGFMIIFFSSNLASYDLIKGYWRSMRVIGKEKRGYGNRQQLSPWFSWYFVNASRAHNYVGVHVKIAREKYNHVLADYLEGEYNGRIVSRIILYEDNLADPYWFLVRMKTPLPLPGNRPDYVLVKLRYQEDSLLYEDYVEVFFKGIPDINLLQQKRPGKDQFPFYGWALMSLDEKIGTRLSPDTTEVTLMSGHIEGSH